MKRESEQRNKIIFSVMHLYKEASTLKQQTILRELLAKLEKQFTQTANLDVMIRENMRGLGYHINI